MNQPSRAISGEGKDGPEGVIARRMVFCPYLRNTFDTKGLINYCSFCLRFFVRCCEHSRLDAEIVCHHFGLVFTDGSCLDNGKTGATAGIGVIIGVDEGYQWSIPVDDTNDPHQKRTSQRAELLAALEGLRLISEAAAEATPDDKHFIESKRHDGKDHFCWVIATDSVYVVKGMTEWLPVWKVHTVTYFATNVFADIDVPWNDDTIRRTIGARLVALARPTSIYSRS
jgi:ribonuclease HI